MSNPDLDSLPPLARAEAMDKPYRPSRRPLLIAAAVTVLVHVAIFSAKHLGEPTPEKIKAVSGPGRYEPAAVVYQNVHAPVSSKAAPRAPSSTPTEPTE